MDLTKAHAEFSAALHKAPFAIGLLFIIMIAGLIALLAPFTLAAALIGALIFAALAFFVCALLIYVLARALCLSWTHRNDE
jgi:membrane protein implicated in regulation of membrane protease activity